MASNVEQTVHQLQHDFQTLMAYVTGPEAQSHTAYEVELTLFRRLLALAGVYGGERARGIDPLEL